MEALSLASLVQRISVVLPTSVTSTKLTTFRQMRDAVIDSVTSEAAAHLSDNLVSLEPNFYWESDQAGYQHEIVINLGAPHRSNIVVLATRSVEDESPVPKGVHLAVSFSGDGVDFTPVSNPVHPGIMEGRVIKPFRFDLTEDGYQYWKVVVSGYGPPWNWPPDPTRLAGVWIGREREITMPHAWPVDDSEVYPSSSLKLPFGMRFGIGRNLRPHTVFSRTYLLTGSDYDQFSDWLSDSGTATPTVLQEGDGDPMLVRVTEDVNMRMMRGGTHVASVRYIKFPLLPAGEVY